MKSFYFLSAITIMGCSAEQETPPPQEETQSVEKQIKPAQNLIATSPEPIAIGKESVEMNEHTLQKVGKIVFQDLEGGFYSFIANDGSRYTLMNLNDEHKIDGLAVKVEGVIVTGMMTTTQFGQLLKIKNIHVE
ncbi:hypothetical protein [Glaciecola sp. KUL10]|uniref:hypothetical protein n=1 Tax=Glaciecola sp. (strain KUL10) TaxID=2161813 RepID=UPI0011B7C3A7|nr:hypothetical protein [Glaciecola sp. KUL10]